jgi:hypothetical protein
MRSEVCGDTRDFRQGASPDRSGQPAEYWVELFSVCQKAVSLVLAYLSPDHAVFVNEVLLPVKLLSNGTSIAQVKPPVVESYLGIGDRADFHGGRETIRLFPDFAAAFASETALLWETRGATALVITGEALVRARGLVAPRVSQPACRSGVMSR